MNLLLADHRIGPNVANESAKTALSVAGKRGSGDMFEKILAHPPSEYFRSHG